MKLFTCLNLLCAILIFNTSFADTPTPSAPQALACWDESYAYTTATVSEPEGEATLWLVHLRSEDQNFFQGLAEGPMANWGLADVSFYLNKSECVSTPNRPDLLDCETKSGLITIAYDENFESRHIFRFLVGDLKFKTLAGAESFVAQIAFQHVNSTKVETMELSFRKTANGQCTNYPTPVTGPIN